MKRTKTGQVRTAFLVTIAVAVPAGLLIGARATAYMESQAAKEAVLRILQTLPRAEPVKPGEPVGMPATEEQRAALLKALGTFSDLLRERNFEGAWEMVHPETQGGWTRDMWTQAYGEAGELDLSDMLDSPFGLMALGKELELVDVTTEGNLGKAHVVASLEFPVTYALRREGEQWLIDMAASDALAAKSRISKQLAALKTSSGAPWPWLLFSESSSDLGSLFGAFLDYGSLPLWDVKREVLSASVAGDKAQVQMVTRGKLHLLLPMESKAGSWNLSIDSSSKTEILEPGEGGEPTVAARVRGGKGAQAACMSNLKQLGLAFMMYCQDYDEKFPPADKWCDVIVPYIKNEELLKCPSDDGPYSYAMNYKLSRYDMAKVFSPAETVVLFESEPSRRNAWDDQVGAMPGASLATPGRHNDGNNFMYADGHVKWARNESVTLDWFRPGQKTGLPAPVPARPPVPSPGD